MGPLFQLNTHTHTQYPSPLVVPTVKSVSVFSSASPVSLLNHPATTKKVKEVRSFLDSNRKILFFKRLALVVTVVTDG